MSPPTSDLFALQDIPDAGRGLIATKAISRGTELLICDKPAVHVIFREYRKEVCAHCFHYDRGRTLPVRDNQTGKVFCTPECRDQWQTTHGELGLEASQKLEAFLKSNSKNIQVFTTAMLEGPKPHREVIANGWRDIDEMITLGKQARGSTKRSPTAQAVYADVLASELSAVLLHHGQPDVWKSHMTPLEVDPSPYKSLAEAQATWDSLLQLANLLPKEMRSSCKSTVSQRATGAGSHNAFGIRAGGEDNEEYMGWAIYPEASYFNHSCAPNVSKQRRGRAWHFTARQDIQVDEQLCISYLGGDEADLSVLQRRTRLQSVWGFVCMCSRCKAEAG